MTEASREITSEFLRSARQSRTLRPLQGLVVPAVFWLLLNLASRFTPETLARTSVTLGIMAAYAAFVIAIVASARAKRRVPEVAERRVALVLGHYNVALMYCLAVFTLRLFVDLSQSVLALPNWMVSGSLVGFFALMIAAGAYAPRSYPTTAEQKAQSADRAKRWLPYIVGLPGTGVAIGVVLGSYSMHYPGSWEYPLIGGLSIAIAYATAAFASIGAYRTWVLATSRTRTPDWAAGAG